MEQTHYVYAKIHLHEQIALKQTLDEFLHSFNVQGCILFKLSCEMECMCGSIIM